MTIEIIRATFRYECGTCHSPAELQSDSDPLSLEGDQWYECANGHVTKNRRHSEVDRSRR